MDLAALRLATELGGHLLSGSEPAHDLILIEHIQAHGLPTLLIFGGHPGDLTEPLAACGGSRAPINVVLTLPGKGTELAVALPFHKLRIGSLVGAVDASLPWLEGRPMMPKRLPGRLRASRPLPLEPAFLRPLERSDLRSHLQAWDEPRVTAAFIQPPWQSREGEYTVSWWPEVARPEGAEALSSPRVLPSQAPFPEALRAALRQSSTGPVPWLPHPGDPANLHALASLTPDLAGFRGPAEAWALAFERLAGLPSPPHFCGRC